MKDKEEEDWEEEKEEEGEEGKEIEKDKEKKAAKDMRESQKINHKNFDCLSFPKYDNKIYV